MSCTMNGRSTLSAPAIRSAQLWILVVGFAIALGGCGGRQLMPTPSLYVHRDIDPFPDVPVELRNNHVDVLYLTDRAREAKPGGPKYGYKRSRSVAFGVSQVDFGKDVSWAD